MNTVVITALQSQGRGRSLPPSVSVVYESQPPRPSFPDLNPMGVQRRLRRIERPNRQGAKRARVAWKSRSDGRVVTVETSMLRRYADAQKGLLVGGTPPTMD